MLVYFDSNPFFNTSEWTPMPLAVVQGGLEPYTFNYAYETSTGNVRVHFFFSALGDGPTPQISTFIPPNHSFKVITITGTVLSLMKRDHINVNDERAVKQYLNIKQ